MHRILVTYSLLHRETKKVGTDMLVNFRTSTMLMRRHYTQRLSARMYQPWRQLWAYPDRPFRFLTLALSVTLQKKSCRCKMNERRQIANSATRSVSVPLYWPHWAHVIRFQSRSVSSIIYGFSHPECIIFWWTYQGKKPNISPSLLSANG